MDPRVVLRRIERQVAQVGDGELALSIEEARALLRLVGEVYGEHYDPESWERLCQRVEAATEGP